MKTSIPNYMYIGTDYTKIRTTDTSLAHWCV